ncbi:hypothetical protein PRIPAC_77058 [Pristionchus pacificus]|uniref:G protein-coupled receptor n=1 Tax=Pristionchus pacificus TaxID=54126 RepID=A0A2A6CMH1_PRIPA|nr:hypothetical protein PRIPAC_77058 [Pristionchus pacificus]|eukprot:PDM79298.1 G protein-coupled receptor [Pristionchus pacificus]
MPMLANLLQPLFLMGLMSNLSALYLVGTKSRKGLLEYKKLLIIFLISDLIYTVLQDIFSPIFAVHEDLFIGYLSGEIQNKIFLSIYCGCVSMSFAIFALHFVYRAAAISRYVEHGNEQTRTSAFSKAHFSIRLTWTRLGLGIAGLFCEFVVWSCIAHFGLSYEPSYAISAEKFFKINGLAFPLNPYESIYIFKGYRDDGTIYTEKLLTILAMMFIVALSIPFALLYLPCSFYLLSPFLNSKHIHTPLRLLTILYSLYPILDPLAIIFMISDYRREVFKIFRWLTFKMEPSRVMTSTSMTSRPGETHAANLTPINNDRCE